jgi:protoporphyrin/coproporphyrin ferrochelatase
LPDPAGVLVMAYGTPEDLDDVEAYYTDIRRGRPPPPELLAELVGRYRAIGGRSPLREITLAQAAGIAARTGVKAWVGQKHAAPFIRDAIEGLAAAGVQRAVGVVLAPHYSALSVGDYERRARAAADAVRWGGELRVIPSWHLDDGYLDWLAGRVSETLALLPARSKAAATVIFSAHSLPERILEVGDPYPGQLAATAAAVATRAGLDRWRIGWQSAGRTGEAWLGPDILDVIRDLAATGATAVVVCPCGFVADHLEILYDIDIEARGVAAEAGLPLVRTRSPNADPEFLDALGSIVAGALAERP